MFKKIKKPKKPTFTKEKISKAGRKDTAIEPNTVTTNNSEQTALNVLAQNAIPKIDSMEDCITVTEISMKDCITAPKFNGDILAQIVQKMDSGEDDNESDESTELATLEREKKMENIVRLAGTSANLRGMGRVGKWQGSQVFAAIREMDDGKRHIEFCQMYPDKSFSRKISFPQADMLMALDQKVSNNGQPGKAYNKFIEGLKHEYYNSLSTGYVKAIDINELVDELSQKLPILPVNKDGSDLEKRVAFYREVAEYAELFQMNMLKDDKRFFFGSEEDITELARKMHLDRMSLLRKLRDYGFLYLPQSSRGFQTNVRFKSSDGSYYTEWVYCIYKLRYIADIEEDTSNVLGYDF